MIHAQQLIGLQFELHFRHETAECVHFEIHGCPVSGNQLSRDLFEHKTRNELVLLAN